MLEGNATVRRILWGAGTPRTMRAHWILQEVGLEYERRPIGSRTGETQTEVLTRVKRFQYCRTENLHLRKAQPSSHTSGGLTVPDTACYRPPIRKPEPSITNGVFF